METAAHPKVFRYAAPAVPNLSAALERERLVRPGEAATMLGVSVATLYRMAREGKLPRARRLSHRVAGWSLAELIRFRDGAPADAAG
jgi:predicted DNA-binding transcriptional regulator AlpA